MIVGVPKEIKNNENRVSLTPASVQELVKRGHKVYVETNAGLGSGIANEEYVAVGAEILETPKEVFDIADIIVKVKEPLACEYPLFKEGQALYTYLHLAPNRELTEALMEKKVLGIAYETVEAPNGSLPLLIPMSEVAGRMSTQVGATLLQKYNGGRGMLLGGVPGVPPANVVVIGGGVVGTNAAKMAIGLGANVTIFDINAERMAYLDDIFANRIHTCYSNSLSLGEALKTADLVIGAVLIPGAKAPCLVSEEMVKTMKEGSVIVDVAIDQGGSIETIDRVTTHDNPSYVKHGVVHYSVANMPGAVPRTSTFALNGATLKHLIALVEKGPEQALKDDPMLMKGLNTCKGYVTYKAVADDLNLEYRDPYTLI